MACGIYFVKRKRRTKEILLQVHIFSSKGVFSMEFWQEDKQISKCICLPWCFWQLEINGLVDESPQNKQFKPEI